ncbi:MAG: glycosyltransferase family 87 protein [Pirellulales bacterium]
MPPAATVEPDRTFRLTRPHAPGILPSAIRPAGLVLAILLTAGLLTVIGRPGEAPVYEKAAIRLSQGEMIYRPDDPPAFTYPPFFALAYVPLLALPAQLRLFAWNSLNLALLTAILALLTDLAAPWLKHHLEGRSATRWTVAGLIAVIGVLGTRFLISPLEYRSHDYWVLLAVLLAARAIRDEREGRAGIWAGLAAACKATPLLLLPMFIWQRRPRAALAMTIAGLLATLLPDVLFPSHTGDIWSVAWYRSFVSKVEIGSAPDAAGAWASWNALNQSLSGTLYRCFTAVPVAEHQWDISLVSLTAGQLRVVTVGLELAIIGLLAWATWRRADQESKTRGFWVLGQFSLVLCAMLLLSPMSSKQHFCALIPGLTFLTLIAWGQPPARLARVALMVVFAVGTLGAKDLIGAAARTQLQAYGSVTWCTMACFLAIAGVLINQSRRMGQAAA